jgi:hypothetical protein
MLGYFVWKITILRQKIIFFPILGGAPGTPPPLDPPLHSLMGGTVVVVIVCSWIYNYNVISAYHYYRCEFEPRSWWGVLDTTLGDKVCQQLTTGRWFSLGTPVSSTNKTDHHDITEILLKVALNTINRPSLMGKSGCALKTTICYIEVSFKTGLIVLIMSGFLLEYIRNNSWRPSKR